MANRWGNDGNTGRLSWAPQSLQMVTSQEIKKRLLLGRKAMTNLDSMLKSRDITLPTKVCLGKAMVSFQESCMNVSVGPKRMLRGEELTPLNSGVGGVSSESLGLQRDPTSAT